MRYAGVTMAEYDEMTPRLTLALGREVWRLRQQEIELEMNLARFAAGARLQQSSEEVRG